MAGQYRFKDINGNIVAQISASSAGAISFSGSAVDFSNASTITLGEVQLAGTASNALLLDGFDSTAFVFTSSFNTISQSISSQLTTLQTTSGSNIGRLSNLETKSSSVDISISNINSVTASNLARLSNLESKSSSVDISISNINSVTASNIARLSNLETKSSSVDISISSINQFTASNGNTSLNQFTASNDNTSLNSKTGSYATTGSNTFFGTQTYSGSVYIANDLIVQGSSSIQYISASSVSIGTNIVQLNTANPSVRFAGLTIIDSGSIGGSGSFLYDSVHDEFIFVHRGNGTNVTSSHFVLGPETFDSLGNETYLTSNIIPKGTGKEHLVDSCIFDNGTTTCIKNNFIGTGTGCFSGNVYTPNLATTGSNTFVNTQNISLTAAGQANGLKLTNLNGGTGDSIGIDFSVSGGGTVMSRISANRCTIIDYADIGLAFSTYSGSLSEKMRIQGNGNVGIGTSTPLSIFHANCCVAGGATTTVARFGVQDSTGYGTTSPAIELTGTNIGLCFTIGKIAGINDVSSGGSMAFSTGLCAGTVIERMRITSCGNVGIGTNCPLRKLHILNNDDTRGILIHNCSTTSYAELHFCASREFRIGTGGTAADSPACNKFYIYDATSSTHRFTIDCTGRIGIGTTTPSELLHVCGNIRTGNIDNSTNFAGTSPYIGIGGSTPLFLVHSSGYGVGYFGYDTGGDRLIIATDNGGGNNKIDFSVNAGTSTDGSTNNVSGIAYAMRIDGSSRVSMPYQPAFKAGLSTSTSVGANSTIIFNDTSGIHFNIGGHYSTSTGMFTAPIAGRYIFSTVVIYQNLSAGQAMDDAFYIYRNSTLVAYSFRRAEYEAGYTGNGQYYVDHANILLNLAASDTVSIRNNRALEVHGNTAYTYFYGYMLG